MFIEHPDKYAASHSETYSQYGGSQYQRYRQMSLDDMLLENRIVFLIGEINYARVFQAIDELGYDGWVGAEYLPQGTTAESLGWFRR